jgi:hypothetical protein
LVYADIARTNALPLGGEGLVTERALARAAGSG